MISSVYNYVKVLFYFILSVLCSVHMIYEYVYSRIWLFAILLQIHTMNYVQSESINLRLMLFYCIQYTYFISYLIFLFVMKSKQEQNPFFIFYIFENIYDLKN